MFTGLVEEIGILKNITHGTNSLNLTLTAKEVLEDVKLGDSIAVNGVCLTVVNFSKFEFKAQVMPETYQKTNLKTLNIGDKVNLERALKVGDRLGGHILSGHVDGVGKISNIEVKDIAKILTIEADEEILNYLVDKGSVALDGTSLTIIKAFNNNFTISLIPHTQDVTVLGLKQVGSSVNIEVDMLSKYVKKFMTTSKVDENKNDVSMNLLLENGFI